MDDLFRNNESLHFSGTVDNIVCSDCRCSNQQCLGAILQMERMRKRRDKMNPRNDTELSAFSIEDILAAADLIDRALSNPLTNKMSDDLRVEAKGGAVALYNHLKTRAPEELVDFIWELQEYSAVP